jgi:hypothetical protein
VTSHPCRKVSSKRRDSPDPIWLTRVFVLQFKLISGSDKTFTRTADSGNPTTSYSCEECSCIMWVKAEAKPAIRMIRTGTIDDDAVLGKMVPSKELYCSYRPGSFAEYPGIVHADEM